MKPCGDRFAPSPEMQAEAFQVAGVEPEINPHLIVWCELETHEGTDHAAGIVEAKDPSGRMTWVWWRSGVEMRDPCLVYKLGDEDSVENVVCCLFEGHEGGHAWP